MNNLQDDTRTDIHIHTYHSGKNGLSIEELLEMALRSGTKVVSFCDHKTLGSLDDLSNLSEEKVKKYKDIRIIIGMEHSCRFNYILPNGREDQVYIDILGYNIDINKKRELEKWVKESSKDFTDRRIQEKELDRIKQIATSLELRYDEDVNLNEEWLSARALATSFAKYSENFTYNPNDPGKFVLSKETQKNPSNFFPFYCNNPLSTFYFNRTSFVPMAETIIDKFKEYGADVVLAHPLSYKQKKIETSLPLINAILEQLGRKIDGIETNYGDYTIEEVKLLEEIATRYHKHFAGGSDYHNGVGWKDIGIRIHDEEPITAGNIKLKEWARLYTITEIQEIMKRSNEKDYEERT